MFCVVRQMSNLRGAVQRRLGGTWGDVAPCLQLPGAGTHAARSHFLRVRDNNLMHVQNSHGLKMQGWLMLFP